MIVAMQLWRRLSGRRAGRGAGGDVPDIIWSSFIYCSVVCMMRFMLPNAPFSRVRESLQYAVENDTNPFEELLRSAL